MGRDIFYRQGLNQGCIRDVRRVHEHYIFGELKKREMRLVDSHRKNCRLCENLWDVASLGVEDKIEKEIEMEGSLELLSSNRYKK